MGQNPLDSDWLVGQCSAEGGYMSLVDDHFGLKAKKSDVRASNPMKVEQKDARLMILTGPKVDGIAEVKAVRITLDGYGLQWLQAEVCPPLNACPHRVRNCADNIWAILCASFLNLVMCLTPVISWFKLHKGGWRNY